MTSGKRMIVIMVLTSLLDDTNQCRTGDMFEYEDDVSKYYICRYGVKVPMFCPINLFFNLKLRDCIGSNHQKMDHTTQTGIQILLDILNKTLNLTQETTLAPNLTTPITTTLPTVVTCAANTTNTTTETKKKDVKKNTHFNPFLLTLTTSTKKPVKIYWQKLKGNKELSYSAEFMDVFNVTSRPERITTGNIWTYSRRENRKKKYPLMPVTLPYSDWELNDMMRRDIAFI